MVATTFPSPVEITRQGPVLWARINRPDSGNACNSAVMAGMEDWIARGGEPETRVLVLTGSGSAFCAGADLAEGTSLLGDPPALHAFLQRGRDMVRRLLRAPVPTIAAVNGAAFGGGLELLLACDIAVAGRSARIGDRHLRVGQVPGWGSSVLLPRAVGPARARRMLLTGEVWTAEQAATNGLVGDVVPDAELDEVVQSVAMRIAGLDPATVRRMLGLARGSSSDAEAAWTREWNILLEHVATQQPDSAETPMQGLHSRD